MKNTAIIITSIICCALVIMTVVKCITDVIDRNNYYNAKVKNPEAFDFTINEEDLKNGN